VCSHKKIQFTFSATNMAGVTLSVCHSNHDQDAPVTHDELLHLQNCMLQLKQTMKLLNNHILGRSDVARHRPCPCAPFVNTLILQSYVRKSVHNPKFHISRITKIES
jgi:hypothetical protein